MLRFSKKIISLLMSAIMVMSLGAVAFAAESDVTFFMSPAIEAGTDYTNIYSLGSDVETKDESLSLYLAGNDYTVSPVVKYYRSLTGPVTWTVTSDPDDVIVNDAITVSSGSVLVDEQSITTSVGSFTVNNKVGVAVIRATSSSGYIDLTVAVDSSIVKSNVNANIYVANKVAGVPYVENRNVTVKTPENDQEGVLYGKKAVFQNTPTAMGALTALADSDSTVTVQLDDDGGYVNSINNVAGDWTNGWFYGVYNASGNFVNSSGSINISASIYELDAAGYTVVWVYAPYDSSYSYTFQQTLAGEISSWGITN